MDSSAHQYGMGIIGNRSDLAYVDTLARVQWLCLPRFDSSFVLGSLLDPKEGGEFSISTPDSFSTKQYYQNNTNVLCTELYAESSAFKVTDFAAPRTV